MYVCMYIYVCIYILETLLNLHKCLIWTFYCCYLIWQALCLVMTLAIELPIHSLEVNLYFHNIKSLRGVLEYL